MTVCATETRDVINWFSGLRLNEDTDNAPHGVYLRRKSCPLIKRANRISGIAASGEGLVILWGERGKPVPAQQPEQPEKSPFLRVTEPNTTIYL